MIGYASRLGVRPGERIAFHVSAVAASGASGTSGAPGIAGATSASGDAGASRGARAVGAQDGGIDYDVDFVRLRRADWPIEGPDFRAEPVPTAADGRRRARPQRIDRGSRAVVPGCERLAGRVALTLAVAVLPTRPGGGRSQALLGTWDAQARAGFALLLDEHGAPALVLGDGRGAVVRLVGDRPLRAGQWVRLAASYDPATGRARLEQTPRCDSVADRLVSSRRVFEATLERVDLPPIPASPAEPAPIVFAAWREGADERGPIYAAHFDGRLEAPRILASALAPELLELLAASEPPAALAGHVIGWWDFAVEPEGRRVVDRSRARRDGRLENLPTRAVAGIRWDATEHDWRRAPDHYGAIHFHSDDLYDAGWPAAFELAIPDDWRSGVHAARLRCGEQVDLVPFFVCPPRGGAAAKLALLIPTATYLAYANMPDPHSIVRRLFAVEDDADGGPKRGVTTVRADSLEQLIAADAEYGPSCYQSHADGSGVHHASHLRPVRNLKPRPDRWAWNADMRIVDWLEAMGVEYDVITDELLDAEGAALIAPYRVVLTGTHPEYTSTAMLDALEAWLARGGRLVYLGANGFYWRIAFSPAWPGALELRRAEDGTRAWASLPGEYHHAWSGELGGLWRRIGRPPNRLVGVGFTAQGFLSASSYARTPAASDPRAGFVFAGVDAPCFGDHGVLGGAAGEEIDRFDLRLGSPPHALVLATARRFGPDVLKTKEEFLATTPPDPADPDVRADLVFFETPGGGAVFSTGSIAWAGSLADRDYDNDVSRITANVVRRFLDPTPFPAPPDERRAGRSAQAPA